MTLFNFRHGTSAPTWAEGTFGVLVDDIKNPRNAAIVNSDKEVRVILPITKLVKTSYGYSLEACGQRWCFDRLSAA